MYVCIYIYRERAYIYIYIYIHMLFLYVYINAVLRMVQIHLESYVTLLLSI